jgi:hypothetical protein
MWTREGVMPLVLRASPSLLYNNLSSCGGHLAYAHVNEVHLITASNVTSRLPLRDRAQVMQVRWCNVRDVDVLVVASVSGVQVWNAEGNHILHFFSLVDYEKEMMMDNNRGGSESTTMTFCRGIASTPGGTDICVGAHSGCVFVFEVGTAGGNNMVRKHSLQAHSAAICSLDATATTLASADDR